MKGEMLSGDLLGMHFLGKDRGEDEKRIVRTWLMRITKRKVDEQKPARHQTLNIVHMENQQTSS